MVCGQWTCINSQIYTRCLHWLNLKAPFDSACNLAALHRGCRYSHKICRCWFHTPGYDGWFSLLMRKRKRNWVCVGSLPAACPDWQLSRRLFTWKEVWTGDGLVVTQALQNRVFHKAWLCASGSVLSIKLFFFQLKRNCVHNLQDGLFTSSVTAAHLQGYLCYPWIKCHQY